MTDLELRMFALKIAAQAPEGDVMYTAGAVYNYLKEGAAVDAAFS